MRGYSLLELLVTLAIVGLLAGLAIPGYSHVMTRALRQDARLALLRIHHQQEHYFATHLRYAAQLGDAPDGLAMSTMSEYGHYLLQVETAPDGTRYTAVATANPSGRQSGDNPCMQLSLNEAGQRRSADVSHQWRENDLYRCWG